MGISAMISSQIGAVGSVLIVGSPMRALPKPKQLQVRDGWQRQPLNPHLVRQKNEETRKEVRHGCYPNFSSELRGSC